MREYDWSKANIDPKSHRFGLVDRKGQQSSVKQVGGRGSAQLSHTVEAGRSPTVWSVHLHSSGCWSGACK